MRPDYSIGSIGARGGLMNGGNRQRWRIHIRLTSDPLVVLQASAI